MRRLAFLALFLVGCGEIASLELAPEPNSFEGGPWAVEFRLELDPGFWAEGSHRYQLWLECEPLGRRRWSQHNFVADTDSAIIEDDVFVRLSGLSTHRSGPAGIKQINTDQPTIAVMTVLNLERVQAEQASGECVAELRLQDGDVHYLTPGEPFRV
ncbi:MAG TPA: hypothetical protein VG872_10650 [Acidimicrobiia bacterium]|jgi:hypothetical protein|nr:hypothetical protein [Acidimicrobiia bacterium]